MSKQFVVPSNFRYAQVPILESDWPAHDDRIFSTFDEARDWVVDIANKTLASHENERDTCYEEEDYDAAIRGIERARRLLKTVKEMDKANRLAAKLPPNCP